MSYTRNELLAMGLRDPSAFTPEETAKQEKIRQALGDILATKDEEASTHGERFKQDSPSMIQPAPPKTPRTAALTQSWDPGVHTYQRLLDALKLCQTLEGQLEMAGNTMNWQSDENTRLRANLELILAFRSDFTSPEIYWHKVRDTVKMVFCRTCNGRGEIGGITASDPGGHSEPCPDCQP